MPNTNHIKTSRIENIKIPQTISRCLVCEDVHSISDCADAKAKKSHKFWVAARHGDCAEVYKAAKFPHTNYQDEAV